MSTFSDFLFETRSAASALAEYVRGNHLRLGVTGLSRAGKTVFITAMVENLVRAAAAARENERILPVFRVHADGRMIGARLEAQPDDHVPRFAWEDHLAALTGQDRHWPDSTRRISELRVTIEFERGQGWRQGRSDLTIDIVDYPGEWLLDLPLLTKSYAQWSRDTLEASASAARAPLAADWRAATLAASPEGPASEEQAQKLAGLFTDYLRAARADRYALSTLPPGRFLMPGDMEGSPALTFAPLRFDDGEAREGSLRAMMERRYESYKTHVVRPFFRDHFARLDRQIVLVDALSSLNSGPAAVRDLETALTEVLMAFRAGKSSILSTIFRPKIDRILFAATKADHLHHESHDRLEAILRMLVARAIARAEDVGARVDVVAMAAVRATREALVKQGRMFADRADLEAIVGVPLPGETIDGETFDGAGEVAIYPGDLPADPKLVFRGDGLGVPAGAADYRFVRFRPPLRKIASDGKPLPAPSIRLDRALEFLLGDRLL
ncbi:MAG: YcjX family protein [Hyphomicrobiales bacterium]|nr:YcjX family protein [Hyphomicrobiales bacterium]